MSRSLFTANVIADTSDEKFNDSLIEEFYEVQVIPSCGFIVIGKAASLDEWRDKLDQIFPSSATVDDHGCAGDYRLVAVAFWEDAELIETVTFALSEFEIEDIERIAWDLSAFGQADFEISAVFPDPPSVIKRMKDRVFEDAVRRGPFKGVPR